MSSPLTLASIHLICRITVCSLLVPAADAAIPGVHRLHELQLASQRNRGDGIRVDAIGAVTNLRVHVSHGAGGSMSSNSVDPGFPDGLTIDFEGRMPPGWDLRKDLRINGDDVFRPEIPLRVDLLFPGIRPIPLQLSWTSVRGGFSLSFPVCYPAEINQATLAFRKVGSETIVGRWLLSRLPKTHNVLGGITPSETFTAPNGLQVEAAACRHRSTNPKDEPDEIVVGGGLAGSNRSGGHLADIRLSLPFACDNGGYSGSCLVIDGARKFMIALPTRYADQIHAIRLEATVVTAKSNSKTLKVGKVLLQKTLKGWTVAGRHWTTKVDGYTVFVSEVTGDAAKPSPTAVRLAVELRPPSETGPWFEVATSDHTFAAKGESVLITLPKGANQREVDLSLFGRIVQPGKETKLIMSVPVRGSSLPKSFPPYQSGLFIEPYLEGSMGGFVTSG